MIKISRELGKRSLPRPAVYSRRTHHRPAHARSGGRLVTVLHQLVSKGATVVVIEHNADDHPGVRLRHRPVGPGGGENGGRILAAGTPEAIMADPASVTGKFLTEERRLRRRRV